MLQQTSLASALEDVAAGPLSGPASLPDRLSPASHDASQ